MAVAAVVDGDASEGPLCDVKKTQARLSACSMEPRYPGSSARVVPAVSVAPGDTRKDGIKAATRRAFPACCSNLVKGSTSLMSGASQGASHRIASVCAVHVQD
jgi:hypothetical protein